MGIFCSRFEDNCSVGEIPDEQRRWSTTYGEGEVVNQELAPQETTYGGEEEEGNQESVISTPYEARKEDKNQIEEKEEKKKKKEKGNIFLWKLIFILIFMERIRIRKEEEEEDRSYFLCDDLQLLIMSKLPAQSLIKLRSVSTNWHRWIFREHSFIGKVRLLTDGIFYRDRTGFSYLPYNNNSSSTASLSNSLLSLPTVDGVSFNVFRSACNGLLLLSAFRNRNLELLVHNLFTRQSLLLPLPPPDTFGPFWIGYDPRRSPYFDVVRAVYKSGRSLVLQIFSSRRWTWHELVRDLPPITSQKCCAKAKSVTDGGFMFVDLTFNSSAIVRVDLTTTTTGNNEYEYEYLSVSVPLPDEITQHLEDDSSSLGICRGDILYAYLQTGVLSVYKLVPLQQGCYRWDLLLRGSLDKIVRKAGRGGIMTSTCRLEVQNFLVHAPVLLISCACSVTRRCKVFSYNFINGSIVQVIESESSVRNITPLSICPLEIYPGNRSL